MGYEVNCLFWYFWFEFELDPLIKDPLIKDPLTNDRFAVASENFAAAPNDAVEAEVKTNGSLRIETPSSINVPAKVGVFARTLATLPPLPNPPLPTTPIPPFPPPPLEDDAVDEMFQGAKGFRTGVF